MFMNMYWQAALLCQWWKKNIWRSTRRRNVRNRHVSCDASAAVRRRHAIVGRLCQVLVEHHCTTTLTQNSKGRPLRLHERRETICTTSSGGVTNVTQKVYIYCFPKLGSMLPLIFPEFANKQMGRAVTAGCGVKLIKRSCLCT